MNSVKHFVLLLLLVCAQVSLYSQTFNLDWGGALGGGEGIVFTTKGFARGDDGTMYTAGRLRGSLDLDPGPDSLLLVAGHSQSSFVVAYDSLGGVRWFHRLPGNGEILGLSVAADGSLFAVGTSDGPGDWNPGPGRALVGPASELSVETYSFLLKFNAAGEFQWVHSFGDNNTVHLNDVVVTPGGSVFVTGDFDGTTDFDPSANVALLTPTGSRDILLARYNLQGELTWAKAIGGSGSFEIGKAIQLDGQGHVLLAGECTPNTDFDPGPGVYSLGSAAHYVRGFVAKYDYAGQLMWVNRMASINPSGSWPLDIVPDGQGGCWTAVRSIDGNLMADAYSDTILQATRSGSFVLHYDVGGRFQAGYALSGPNGISMNALALDGNGGTWVAGICGDSADFDPGPGVTLVPRVENAFLAHYSPASALLRVMSWGDGGNETATGLVNLPGGGCAVVSQFSGAADFDPGPGTAWAYSGRLGMTFAVAQYDFQGDLTHLAHCAPMGGGDDCLYNIMLDSAGNTYMTLQYVGVVDLDPGPNTRLQGNPDEQQMALLKFNPSRQLEWAIPLTGCQPSIGETMALDAAGNIYLQLELMAPTDFDPTPSLAVLSPTATAFGQHNVVLARYTPAGQLDWAQLVLEGDAFVWDFDVDAQGNAYLLGRFDVPVDLDPSPATLLLTPDPGQSNGYLQKLDPNGNLAWAHRFDNDAAYRLYNLCANPLGGVYVGGAVYQGGDLDPTPGGTYPVSNTAYAFVHLRGDGSFDWAQVHDRPHPASQLDVLDIDAAADGRMVAVGRASQGWDFDPLAGTRLLYPGTGAPTTYPFLACYDSTGALVYADRVGAAWDAKIERVDVRADGLAVVGGHTDTVVVFASTPQGTLQAPRDRTPLMAVYAPDGQWLAATVLPCADGILNQISVHAGADRILVGGGFRGDIDLDPQGSLVYPGKGLVDAFWASYRLCTPPSVTYVEQQSVVCLGAAPITLTAGSPAGGTYFGGGVSGNTFSSALVGQGTLPITYTFTDTNGCTASDSSTIRVEVCTEAPAPVTVPPSVRVWPNPSSGTLSIATEGLPGPQLSLDLYNSLGQCVHSGVLPAGGDTYMLAHLPAGVYVVRVAGARGAAVTRWVKVE